MPRVQCGRGIAAVTALLLALAAPPAAAAAAASGALITVAQKEQATSRLLQQLSDLGARGCPDMGVRQLALSSRRPA